MRLMHPEAVQRSKPLPSSSSTSSSSSSALENEKGEEYDGQECNIEADQDCQDGRATHPCPSEDKSRHLSPTLDEAHSLIEDSGITRPVPRGPGPRDLVLEELITVTSAKVTLS